MKYTLISILLLAFLLCFCLWSAGYVSSAVSDTEGFLIEAMELERQGDQQACLTAIRRASANWDRYQTWFGTVLRHDAVDDVKAEFSRLEAYAVSQDTDDFRSNCAALLSTLEHIREMEWPYLYNIL